MTPRAKRGKADSRDADEARNAEDIRGFVRPGNTSIRSLARILPRVEAASMAEIL